MTENETIATVEVAAETPAKKAKTKDKSKAEDGAKPKVKAKAQRAKAEKPARPDREFDFVGKVESLRVKSGAGAEGFEFGLRGRRGKRRGFRFDSADSFAANAMALLVLAAHASGSRIGVRTAGELEGVLIVRELESRPKMGKGG
ncbi:MAG: hypothetical protein IOC82_04765 [Aestuariivirga sp.]|uniref:hypothetical protein n=1 Tax=Aestuariivirga sp. TaxID=2650926 RepID=UPI0025BCB62C|nr:hypothetical protein [Aestuariivirga sp.]MCA3560325.1 hypothetical protein [Aestuariivirga sp.]